MRERPLITGGDHQMSKVPKKILAEIKRRVQRGGDHPAYHEDQIAAEIRGYEAIESLNHSDVPPKIVTAIRKAAIQYADEYHTQADYIRQELGFYRNLRSYENPHIP